MDAIQRYKRQAIIELKKLGKSQSSKDDLNFIFSAALGLVRTNLEIKERIHAHRKEVLKNGPNPKQFVTYTRYIFREVKVATPQQGYGGKQMTFTVMPEAQTRTFLPQPAFPKLLRSFVPFDEDGGLAKEWCNSRLKEDQYTRFLTSAALLSTDVLIPILDVFKSHLEDLQVYFGEIEGWILEVSANKRYLETTFKTNLGALEVRCGSVGNDCVCQRCNEELSLHSHSGSCRPENLRLQRNNGYNNGYNNIYNNGTNLPPEPPPKYSKEGEFWYVQPAHIQKLTEVVSEDSHVATFDVSTDSGRTKLNRFLAYVNVCT